MDTFIRAHARLTALKQNLPENGYVKESYINTYHQIVDLLAKETNSSLEEFKVPQNDIKYRITSFWPSIPAFEQKGGRTYSDDKYCERTLFLSKLDAFLSYFEFRYLSREKSQIGFKTENI